MVPTQGSAKMPPNRASLPKVDNMGLKSRVQGVVVVAAVAATSLVGQPLSASAVAPGAAVVVSKQGHRPVVRVASFNVRAVKNDVRSGGDEQPWRERRDAVIRQILGEHLDVLGVQEASQNGNYKAQMVDGR